MVKRKPTIDPDPRLARRRANGRQRTGEYRQRTEGKNKRDPIRFYPAPLKELLVLQVTAQMKIKSGDMGGKVPTQQEWRRMVGEEIARVLDKIFNSDPVRVLDFLRKIS